MKYLRGYYGAKNFGDEFLLLGILNFFDDNFVIECFDEEFLHSWLNLNKNFLKQPISSYNFCGVGYNKKNKISYLYAKLKYIFLLWGKYFGYEKFIGGGEVFNWEGERGVFYGGLNILILFWKDILFKNFNILGGLSVDDSKFKRFFYKIVLTRAKKIFIRDKVSLEIAKKYNKKVFYTKDFAWNFMENFDKNKKVKKVDLGFLKNFGNYILVNLNKKGFELFMEQKNSIKKFILDLDFDNVIFFPADLGFGNDLIFLEKVENFFVDELGISKEKIISFDWRKYDIGQILGLFENCKAGIGARLHFLLPLKFYNKKIFSLIYKDKVRKIILDPDY